MVLEGHEFNRHNGEDLEAVTVREFVLSISVQSTLTFWKRHSRVAPSYFTNYDFGNCTLNLEFAIIAKGVWKVNVVVTALASSLKLLSIVKAVKGDGTRMSLFKTTKLADDMPKVIPESLV